MLCIYLQGRPSLTLRPLPNRALLALTTGYERQPAYLSVRVVSLLAPGQVYHDVTPNLRPGRLTSRGMLM